MTALAPGTSAGVADRQPISHPDVTTVIRTAIIEQVATGFVVRNDEDDLIISPAVSPEQAIEILSRPLDKRFVLEPMQNGPQDCFVLDTMNHWVATCTITWGLFRTRVSLVPRPQPFVTVPLPRNRDSSK